jgi:hypothetical protein
VSLFLSHTVKQVRALRRRAQGLNQAQVVFDIKKKTARVDVPSSILDFNLFFSILVLFCFQIDQFNRKWVSELDRK